MHDGEVDHVRQGPVQQLLAVEAEHRAGQAADTEQRIRLSRRMVRHSSLRGNPSSFSFARRGRRCQTMLPIAAAIASTATTRISVAISLRRCRPWRLSAFCSAACAEADWTARPEDDPSA